MKIKRNKTSFISIFIGLIIIGVSFFVGVYLGYENRPPITKVISLTGAVSEVVLDSEKTDFSPFWKTWNFINEKFVTANGSTTDQEKIWGAIEGLVGSLNDPYSVFLPPREAELFTENIRGNFGGVGMEIGIRDGILTVIAPLKDTPADRAGILTGDKIIKVDDIITADMKIDEAVSIIRGEMGTTVTLTIFREDVAEPFDISIVRDKISIPTIEYSLRDDGIFSIELYSFTATSPELFRQALQEFVLSGSSKLVLDLRNNPGGFLDAAVEMASWFLPSGKVVVTEDFGERKESIVYRSRGYDIFSETLEMVILINKGSASASEILAGALSEHGIATLVGETSFGKGSVQELVDITSDTSLKITVARWKTPQGNSISKNGLTPEYEVEFTMEDREEGRDPQMEKALELLIGA